MDDLISLVRAMFKADPVIIALWAEYAPPGTNPEVRSPGGKADPVYPDMVLTGSPGRGIPTGEGTQQFLDGSLRLTTFARDTDTSNGKDVMWQIANRATVLLAGDAGDGQGGIKDALPPSRPGPGGTPGPPLWRVFWCRLTNPSGPVEDPDPLVGKHVATYKVLLYRL